MPSKTRTVTRRISRPVDRLLHTPLSASRMTWTHTKKTMFKDGLSKQWGGLPHSLLFGHSIRLMASQDIADESPATKGLQLSTRTFPLPRCHRQHTSSKRTTLQTPANPSLNLHPQFPRNSRPSALEEFFSTSTPGLIPYKKDHTT